MFSTSAVDVFCQAPCWGGNFSDTIVARAVEETWQGESSSTLIRTTGTINRFSLKITNSISPLQVCDICRLKVYTFVCLSVCVSLSLSQTHTHTHTHVYFT